MGANLPATREETSQVPLGGDIKRVEYVNVRCRYLINYAAGKYIGIYIV